MSFSKLLTLLGFDPHDMVNVFTLPDAISHWTTAALAEAEAARWAGEQNVYYGVQPMVEVLEGRGKSRDVAYVHTLYADLDFKDGADSETHLQIISELSAALGSPPSAIVASGHGLQPYWPVEPVETVTGALLLLRWRQLVIQVAAARGVKVDQGVYDLPRILRVPGPPNIKYAESAKTGVVFPAGAYRLAYADVIRALDAALPDEPKISEFSGRLESRESSGGDRVFTDAQAMAYLEEFAFAPARETPWGSGEDYWKVIWRAAATAAMFTSMYDEDDLKDMLRQAIAAGHGGQVADMSDEYQIAMGFAKPDAGTPRRPTEAELNDPFSPHCNLQPRLAEIREAYNLPVDAPLTTEVVYTQESPSGFDDVRRLKVTRLSDIPMQAATWLWEYEGEFWLPLRSLVLLGGREGVGKSTWTARLIAQVTNGKMHGEYLGQPKSVIIAAAEDSFEVTIKPRLIAAGADPQRVLRVDAEQGAHTFGLTLPTDVPAMEKLVRLEDVALIILDPLLGTVEGKLDTHKDSDVRRALAPISALAHETHCTVIGLIHQNKSQSGDLLTRMMGSRAFAAVARAVLVCAEAPLEDELSEAQLLEAGQDDRPKPPRSFLFGQLKNNLGPRVETSVRYEIEGATVGKDPENQKPIRTSRIRITKYRDLAEVEETVLAKEKKAAAKSDGRRKPEGESIHDKCVEWLRDLLDVSPRPAREVKSIGAVRGFNNSAIQRASKQLEVKMVGEYHNPTWSLPQKEDLVG